MYEKVLMSSNQHYAAQVGYRRILLLSHPGILGFM